MRNAYCRWLFTCGTTNTADYWACNILVYKICDNIMFSSSAKHHTKIVAKLAQSSVLWHFVTDAMRNINPGSNESIMTGCGWALNFADY